MAKVKNFRAANEGNHKAEGWPESTYAVSKVALSALTRIQQRNFDKDPREDLVVNSCHPGYVATFMTNFKVIHLIVQFCKRKFMKS